MDFTTAQKAATLARVALVDVTTTNSDMRGTNSALLASSYTAPDNTGIGVAASAAAAAATSGANIQTRIPAALSGGNMKADVLAIDGSTAAATAQKKAALTVITGTVGAGATTTEIPIKTLNMSIADIDQLLGLIIGFPVAAGTGRAGQKSDITGASPIGPVISVTALTRAPSEDDEFVIL
jgi:hypothetical protein